MVGVRTFYRTCPKAKASTQIKAETLGDLTTNQIELLKSGRIGGNIIIRRRRKAHNTDPLTAIAWYSEADKVWRRLDRVGVTFNSFQELLKN